MRARSWIRIAALASGVLSVGLLSASVDASPTRSLDQGLGVSVAGNGHVSSSPSGIDCPSTCKTAFKVGEKVSLSAKASSGWTFAGWSGDCKGTGGCGVVMDADHSVGASFTENAPPPATTTTATTTQQQTTTSAPAPPPPATPGPPTLEGFDALANGACIDRIVGVHFKNAVCVVTPAHVAPSSFPRALAGKAPGQSCAAGNVLEMSFDTPVVGLSLRSGIDDVAAPNDGTWARLLGYDASGRVVATSGDVLVAVPGHLSAIQTSLAIASAAGDIAAARLSVGCGTASHDTGPRRPEIDDVVVTPSAAYLAPVQITIDSPEDGAVFPAGTPTITGTVYAPNGVQNFCVVNTSDPRIPEVCNQQVAFGGRSPLAADGHYSIALPVARGGLANVTAFVRDRRNQVAHAFIHVRYPDARDLYTLNALNMEITQGVQAYQLPVLDESSPPVPGIGRSFPLGAYQGVRLAQGKRTVVRLFAQATPITVERVDAQLWGYRSSGGALTPLPGSPVGPDFGARTLQPSTIRAQRTRADGGFVFTLPPSWTSGTITLVAKLVAPPPSWTSGTITIVAKLLPPATVTGAAELNTNGDVIGVRSILFEHQNDFTLTAIGETNHDPVLVPPTPVQPVFSDFVTMMPTGDGQVHVNGYAAMIDVQGGWNVFDIFNHDMHLIDALCGYSPGAHDGQLVGVFAHGITNDAVTAPAPGCLGRGNLAVVDPERTRTTVAHELGHIMGRPHSSGACGGGFPQPWESWPPDERGLLNGVGLDTRTASGGRTGQYNLFFPGFGNNGYGGTDYYDYMSYCSGQGSTGADCQEVCSWISPSGWTELFDWLHTHAVGFRPAERAATPGGRGFAITAGTDGNGKGDILSVRPAVGPPTPSNEGAEYQLIVRDASGAVLERLGLDGAAVHLDTRKPVVPLFFGATVPAAAHQLQLAHGDVVLGTRTRSAHAPAVALLGPRRGARVTGKGTVVVRWRARDADRDRLLAELDYSSDGGRTFHTVAAGLSGTRFALPVSMLASSRRARLRLVVSDGWNQTTALSPIFVAPGAAPRVSITSPRRNFSLKAKALLYLSGGATTNGGGALTGRQLTWYAGKKLLGHGVSLGVTLPKGRVAIRLVARDASARTSTATVTVTIR